MFPLLAMVSILQTQTDVINVNTLLPEMAGLERLARRPKHAHKAMQASSYDRKSIAPDKPNWFANEDWGQYIRDEVNDGRKEHVMADIQGAGAVTRVWSANPAGTVIAGSPVTALAVQLPPACGSPIFAATLRNVG